MSFAQILNSEFCTISLQFHLACFLLIFSCFPRIFLPCSVTDYLLYYLHPFYLLAYYVQLRTLSRLVKTFQYSLQRAHGLWVGVKQCCHIVEFLSCFLCVIFNRCITTALTSKTYSRWFRFCCIYISVQCTVSKKLLGPFLRSTL